MNVIGTVHTDSGDEICVECSADYWDQEQEILEEYEENVFVLFGTDEMVPTWCSFCNELIDGSFCNLNEDSWDEGFIDAYVENLTDADAFDKIMLNTENWDREEYRSGFKKGRENRK